MGKSINWKSSSAMESLSTKISSQSRTGSTTTKIKRKKQLKSTWTKRRKGKPSSKVWPKEFNKWKNNLKRKKKMSELMSRTGLLNCIHLSKPKLNSKSKSNSKMINWKLSSFKTENSHKNSLLFRETKKSKWSWLLKTKTTKWINSPKSESPLQKNKQNTQILKSSMKNF